MRALPLALCSALAACSSPIVRTDAGHDSSSPVDAADALDATDATDALDTTAMPDALDASDVPLAPDATDVVPPVDAPSTLAGTYAITVPDFAVTPDGSARVVDVGFDPTTGAFVTAYTWVPPGGLFRTEVRAISLAGGAPAVSDPAPADDAPAGVTHNTGDCSIAVGAGRALAVFWDDRASNGNGQLDIYGGFVRVTGGATPTAVSEGPPFNISQASSNEWLPAAGYDPVSNGYVVAWADDRDRNAQNENGRVVYARHIAADGTIGPEVRVGDTTPFQTMPQVVYGAGRFMVAWSDFIVPDGTTIVLQYHARFLDAATGQPVSAIFPIETNAGAAPDPPAIAYDTRRGEWLVAWTGGGPPSVRQVHAAVVAPDGSLTRAPYQLTTMPEGAGSPRIAYSPRTASYLLTFHAQDSADAFGLEIAPGGDAAGTARALNPTPPPLGTFFTSVAADTVTPVFVALRNTDYARIHGTVFTAPAGL